MIDSAASFWMGLGLGVLIGGALVGVVLWWRAHRLEKAGRSVKALEAEHAKFRGEVNDHFVETAELINRLTDSYKAVFDHLSQGAEQLVEDRVAQSQMPKVGDGEVRLKHIGHRVSLQPDADGRDADHKDGHGDGHGDGQAEGDERGHPRPNAEGG
ncbi:MAG: DUF1043 family protein [Wenzhouxiangella sp.]|nr:DUF1043 family protein [Wenzhouxiangella sp.]